MDLRAAVSGMPLMIGSGSCALAPGSSRGLSRRLQAAHRSALAVTYQSHLAKFPLPDPGQRGWRSKPTGIRCGRLGAALPVITQTTFLPRTELPTSEGSQVDWWGQRNQAVHPP